MVHEVMQFSKTFFYPFFFFFFLSDSVETKSKLLEFSHILIKVLKKSAYS